MSLFEAYGEVDQVFPCFGVVNGLGCPYPFDVGELLGIGFFQVDDAVRPIGQVAGFEQDDAGIVFPTVLSGEHVCGRDIKGVPVFSAQDVRVAYASGLGYFVRWDDGAVPVQGFPSVRHPHLRQISVVLVSSVRPNLQNKQTDRRCGPAFFVRYNL